MNERDLNFEAMLKTRAQMKELMTSLTQNATKNRKQMRLEAISKIQAYFKEKIELCEKYDYHPRLELEGISICSYSTHHNLHIFFEEDSTVTLWQLGGASNIEINNFCELKEEDMLRDNGEVSTWKDGFIPIINNWQQIKEKFEETVKKDIEKYLAKLDKNAQETLNNEFYLKNFEV